VDTPIDLPEWQQAKRSGYSVAAKNGWVEKCTLHMELDGRKTVGQRSWTKEKCLELANPCTSRPEFKNPLVCISKGKSKGLA